MVKLRPLTASLFPDAFKLATCKKAGLTVEYIVQQDYQSPSERNKPLE